jgi:hypothetical protein
MTVSAAMELSRPEKTSLNSSTPIWYRLAVRIFCISATVQKFFDIFDLAGNPHRDLKSLRFWGTTRPTLKFVGGKMTPKGLSCIRPSHLSH